MVNNIAGVDKHKRKLERIINTMESRNLDIFLGQEMNIQTRNRSFLQFIRRKENRECHFVTSESRNHFTSYKKPGGTFCITGQRLKSRVKEKIVDHMGRWAGCAYQLKKVTIAFISVYQTVDSSTHGPNSIHSQQLAILLSENRTSVTP